VGAEKITSMLHLTIQGGQLYLAVKGQREEEEEE
jgi:hypothetical protein